jgi:hypothetical protein
MVRPSDTLVAAFIGMAMALGAGFIAAFVWIERRRGGRLARAGIAALVVLGWLVVTGTAADAGLLGFERRPPVLPLLMVILIGSLVALTRSAEGGRLATGIPLAWLVGWQAFRLPLELLLHRSYSEGLMPVQMSYEGLNFDILTGASALVLAPLIARGKVPLGAVRVWNVLGMLLLLNIMTIAVLSAPTPLRVFHNPPANVWITRFPFVWLPTVMVATALLGHLLIFRRLGVTPRREPLRRAEADLTVTAGPAAVG